MARTIDPDDLRLDDLRAGSLAGRPVTVLGFARSGIAAARFLADRGARVTVYDGRPASALADATAALDGRPFDLRAGPNVDPASTWHDAALVVTSPSINPDYPTTEPRLRAQLQALVRARAGGDRTVPALVSEPDLFLRLCPAPTVGVTGTKGKTTTSSLLAALLAGDPVHPAVLGGNIGTPLIERLPELTPEHRVVIELSELQLPTLSRGTTVAVYTNVTADHLDRHGSLAAYRRVKRRLAELVDPDGALVLNAEDPVVAAYAGLGTAPSLLYRLDRPIAGGVGLVDGWIVAAGVQRLPLAGDGPAAVGPGGRIMPVGELAIPGRHNVGNALAAIGAALLFGVAPDAIRRAAAAFTGVEHRLETVAVANGVRYVNDSQGTQPDAVIAALHAFPPPVVLVAGGRDKGVDLAPLARIVAERAVAAVLIGESAPALERLFGEAGLARIERASSLEAAVEAAASIARAAVEARGEAGTGPAGPIGTVLLSPAATSFDMFVDYAARGRAFKAAVRGLVERETKPAAAPGGAGGGGEERAWA
ncbi:MAG: UDP-N-acetylmuramoyl-L-alanine--D-glutamate ligase [Chloroflexi bacterium]|nr:UDP-N-acetylmuramoyl-L-alanine--D-glutamate ligase [Chloroflexota bacterium]